MQIRASWPRLGCHHRTNSFPLGPLEQLPSILPRAHVGFELNPRKEVLGPVESVDKEVLNRAREKTQRSGACALQAGDSPMVLQASEGVLASHRNSWNFDSELPMLCVDGKSCPGVRLVL